MNVAWSIVFPGVICCRHCDPKAQILNAEATGPRVAAIMGKAEEANHHRLLRIMSVTSENTVYINYLDRERELELNGGCYLGTKCAVSF